MGLNWTTWLKDGKHNKLYGRPEINRIVTEYYKLLYHDKGKITVQNEKINHKYRTSNTFR